MLALDWSALIGMDDDPADRINHPAGDRIHTIQIAVFHFRYVAQCNWIPNNSASVVYLGRYNSTC